MAEERIFPILDRDAPVLTRLRNGSFRGQDTISTAVTEILGVDDEEERKEIAEKAVKQIRSNISEATGAAEDNIDGEFFDRLQGSLELVEPEDIASSLNIEDDNSSEDSEDEDDSDQTGLEKF